MANSDYNPDVLNCLANLSNDEVFTPPVLANQMLDLLPQELFSNPKTTFLDPFCKSGVFLREIVKRLDVGLQKVMPDRRQRIDHILHHQVFGIAITELTAYLSRRSVYCSRCADGPHSVSRFLNADGNIRYKPLRHAWEQGKCKYCGASQAVYDRGEASEQYAYQFIHTDNPEKIFNMKFDVIIGNPPYQLNDGSGGSSDSAMPIYHKFINQAILLQPRYLSMIVPSKWMVGGRGLNVFRRQMIDDKRIEKIFDYEDASECFQGIHIDGGVCYFLWNKDYYDKTEFHYKPQNGEFVINKRFLKNNFFDYVIRDSRVNSILEKIGAEQKFSSIVSNVRPYGVRGYLFNEPERYPNSQLSDHPYKNSVKIYGVKGIKGGARRVSGFVNHSIITANHEEINKYKLFFTTSYSTGAIEPPKVIEGAPGEICTETFLRIGPFSNSNIQQNCLSYIETHFLKYSCI